MIRFQADADLNRNLILAVRRREPAIEFPTAGEADLLGMPDPEVLEFAACHHRILVTHDRRTMLEHFRTRLAGGHTSTGMFLISQFAPHGLVVDALLLVWAASSARDWRDQVHYLPSFARHVFPR